MFQTKRTRASRPSRSLICLALGGASLLAWPGVSAAQTADPDEIIVTAQKRETRVLDTAEALTALRGDTLEATGGEGLGDLAALVPGLSYSENFGISQIFIRGVGNSFFSPGGDPGVALYADGVYLSDQEATGVAFLDVERIEVLRGPQGALYGRNATGGAVNVLSRSPTQTFEGALGVTAGDFGRQEVDGTLSGPVGDKLRARLAVRYRNLDGYAENELPGGPDPLDAEESLAGRLQLAADVGGGDLRITINGLTQDDAGPGLKILPDPTPQPAQFLFGLRPSASERNYVSQVASNTRDVSSATAQWRREMDGFDLTLIADHRVSDRLISYDQDGTAATQSVTTLDTSSDQSSIEAYLASNGEGPFQWLAGASYIAFDQSRTTTVSGVLPGAFVNPALSLSTPFPFLFKGGGDLESKAWAAYGEGSLALSPKLTVRVGARYNSDKKDADEFLDFFGLTRASQGASWNEWSGRASVEYRPTDQALVYATASRGFKAGALNIGAFTPSVNPEIIINYEIGAKLSSADGRADLSVAAFTSDYTDLQVVQIGPLSQILSNAAAASMNGVEVEGTLRPTRAFRLGFTAAWLDATYDTYAATDQRRGFAVFNLAGKQLPLTSEWQAGVLAAYDWSTPSNGVVSITANYSWRSEYFFTEFNTPDASQDAFGRLDLGVSWTDASDTWTLSAFARNVTDETAIGSMAIVSPLLGSVRVVSLEPPRHFGVRLAYGFR